MGSYIDFDVENNNKDPKFKFGGHVITSKYKNIFAKGYTPNWSEGVFLSKKLKLPHYGHMLLLILTMKNCWNVCITWDNIISSVWVKHEHWFFIPWKRISGNRISENGTITNFLWSYIFLMEKQIYFFENIIVKPNFCYFNAAALTLQRQRKFIYSKRSGCFYSFLKVITLI